MGPPCFDNLLLRMSIKTQIVISINIETCDIGDEWVFFSQMNPLNQLSFKYNLQRLLHVNTIEGMKELENYHNFINSLRII